MKRSDCSCRARALGGVFAAEFPLRSGACERSALVRGGICTLVCARRVSRHAVCVHNRARDDGKVPAFLRGRFG